jgi:hypothetical protein
MFAASCRLVRQPIPAPSPAETGPWGPWLDAGHASPKCRWMQCNSRERGGSCAGLPAARAPNEGCPVTRVTRRRTRPILSGFFDGRGSCTPVRLSSSGCSAAHRRRCTRCARRHQPTSPDASVMKTKRAGRPQVQNSPTSAHRSPPITVRPPPQEAADHSAP